MLVVSRSCQQGLRVGGQTIQLSSIVFSSFLGSHSGILPPRRDGFFAAVGLGKSYRIRQNVGQFLQQGGNGRANGGVNFLTHDGILTKHGAAPSRGVARKAIRHVADGLIANFAIIVENNGARFGRSNVRCTGRLNRSYHRMIKWLCKCRVGSSEIPYAIGFDRIIGSQAKNVGLQIRKGACQAILSRSYAGECGNKINLVQRTNDGSSKDKVFSQRIGGWVCDVVLSQFQELFFGQCAELEISSGDDRV
mmetsp:Transcript_7758/g.21632  ORF Transcript_7758/g.21632 Transcript_7758/m.21632 type:complete len:250 (-) Transcript_7758:111-860(-)